MIRYSWVVTGTSLAGSRPDWMACRKVWGVSPSFFAASPRVRSREFIGCNAPGTLERRVPFGPLYVGLGEGTECSPIRPERLLGKGEFHGFARTQFWGIRFQVDDRKLAKRPGPGQFPGPWTFTFPRLFERHAPTPRMKSAALCAWLAAETIIRLSALSARSHPSM